jgi:hypothetical protein
MKYVKFYFARIGNGSFGHYDELIQMFFFSAQDRGAPSAFEKQSILRVCALSLEGSIS